VTVIRYPQPEDLLSISFISISVNRNGLRNFLNPSELYKSLEVE
jgi:hypothetical protein